MKGCWEPNLKLREALRLFEDQLFGPESIANIGGHFRLSRRRRRAEVLVHRELTDVCHLCLQTSCTPEQPMEIS